MGIVNFHKWLLQKYTNLIIKNKEYDNIYIDINFLLHYSSYGVTDETMLMKRLCANILLIITTYKPKRSVILVTDGTPPMAKLLLQRKRRIVMTRKTDEPSSISKDGINSINSKDNQDSVFSSLIFTVGTVFMDSLDRLLNTFITVNEKKYNIKIKTIFDSPNEAEMNILKRINKTDIQYTNLIVSNDADVIVMSCASHNNNIYVANIYSGKNIVVYSIQQLLDNLQQEYKISKIDFALLMLLMGNDYLPKLYFSTFDILLKHYKNDLLIYADNIFSFNTDNLKNYFSNIVINLHKSNIGRYSFLKYDHNKVKYYLEGLIWCITNYSTGHTDKFDYMYQFTPIHPLDILFFLETNTNINILYPLPFSEPIDSHLYAVLILPKKYKYLLIDQYKSICDSEQLSFLYEEELCSVCIKIHHDLSLCYEQKKFIQYDNSDSEDIIIKQSFINKEIDTLCKQLEKHKIIHKPITMKIINSAINIINKLIN